MTMFDQPAEEPAKGDEIAIDGSHGLILVPPQIISEVGNVPRRDPTDGEPFAVAGGEPSGKLPYVVGECASRISAKSWAARNSPNRDASSPPTGIPSKTLSPQFFTLYLLNWTTI